MKLAAFLTIVLIAVAPLAAAPALAQRSTADDATFDKALDMINSDPAAARKLIEPLANKGDGEALNFLATLVQYGGPGWDADMTRANELREAAVKAGSKAAALNIAIGLMMDEDGDHDHAVELLKIADTDEQLQKMTAYPWGRAYLFGWGVPRDMKKGVAFLEAFVLAAPQDGPIEMDAHFLIGRAYQNGWDVKPDPVLAYTHMARAADDGEMRAQWQAGMMLLNGDGVDVDEEAAFGYVQRSAEQGYRKGMISYAVMLATAQGTEENDPEARKWYRAAAVEGSAHAARGLGSMLVVGEGGPVDAAMGFALLELADAAGDEEAGTLLDQFSWPSDLTRAKVDAAKTAWTTAHGFPDADD